MMNKDKKNAVKIETYERTELVITEFDIDDIITTSGVISDTAPTQDKYEGGIYS